MNEDLIGPAATISILAVVLSLALLHGTHMAQEIQEAWRKLADRHRLRFEPPRRVLHWPEVAGSVAGRPFLLKKAGGGKHARFYMELGLRGDLPAGLKMKPSGPHVTAHLEVLGVPVSKLKEGGREVQINDEIKVCIRYARGKQAQACCHAGRQAMTDRRKVQ
jgi:hypothetical protein